MSLAHDLYGQPSRAFLQAIPLLQAITEYANAAYTTANVPAATRRAIYSLPVRNALSMIERASLQRMAQAEEMTLLSRVHDALVALAAKREDGDTCVIYHSLTDLEHFLIRYLQLDDQGVR